jgi:hypothetical protein
VVHDESHKLSENEAGAETKALRKTRTLTGHPQGEYAYAVGMEANLLAEIKALDSQII